MTENINTQLNPNSGFVKEEENPAFTQDQIKEYGLDKQEEQAPSEELILGKFKSNDDLQDAYKELEKKFHETPHDERAKSSPQEKRNEQNSPTDVDEDAPDVDEQAPKDSDKSLDSTETNQVNDAFKSLEDAGELTDDVVEAFNKAGISKELIEHYKELSEFKQEHELKSIMSEVGSEEEYTSLISWAANTLEQKEIDTFNTIVDHGTPDEIRLAVKNLESKRGGNTSTQIEPQASLVKADAIASVEAGYSSQTEMITDMSDERYASDEKFREAVMRKVSKSNF